MVKNLIIENKRGWIKLVEVFISIMLLAGVLLVVVTKSSTDETEQQTQILNKEIAILTEIQLNDTLRADILNAANLPIEWINFDDSLEDVKTKILLLTPKDLDCKAKLCMINTLCAIDSSSEEEVYSKSVIISSNLNTYSPRELKLYCSRK